VPASSDPRTSSLLLTPRQQADADAKVTGIARALNRSYDNTNTKDHVIVVRSRGKSTAGRPPSDVDMLFVVPHDVYTRFEQRQGNRQSSRTS
jgi:hypothetical protein